MIVLSTNQMLRYPVKRDLCVKVLRAQVSDLNLLGKPGICMKGVALCASYSLEGSIYTTLEKMHFWLMRFFLCENF